MSCHRIKETAVEVEDIIVIESDAITGLHAVTTDGRAAGVTAAELGQRFAELSATPKHSNAMLESAILSAVASRESALKIVRQLRAFLKDIRMSEGAMQKMEMAYRQKQRRAVIMKMSSEGAGTNRIAAALGIPASSVSQELALIRNEYRQIQASGLAERWDRKQGSHNQTRRDEIDRAESLLIPKETPKPSEDAILEDLLSGQITMTGDDGEEFVLTLEELEAAVGGIDPNKPR